MSVRPVRILPRRRVVWWLVTGLLGALLFAVLAWYGRGQMEGGASPLGQAQSLLNSSQKIREENLALIRSRQEEGNRLVSLEQGRKVDQATIATLQKDLHELDQELRKLRREVTFYEGIMEAAGSGTNLNIQGLLLEPMNTAQHYRYKLVLTNMAKNDRLAEGRVEMLLQGIQDGESKTLSIEQLQLDASPESLQFKFKRFRQIKGSLALPGAFVPANVKVRAHIKGQKTPTERDFDWPSPWGEEK